ncbi:UNVERIFIED_CONTAM: hypothetical protein Sangu_2576000 [Sesamum angustifolium]|uniref:Uncharacterized protein n=1 Tax=Sesamum angustifolium TaxID=2727405 RepID=A0AAW2JA11_9LAMI
MKKGVTTSDKGRAGFIDVQPSVGTYILGGTSVNTSNEDVQTKQSGFTWDDERKMIVVTSDEWSSWSAYVESHPDAKGMQNKMIEHWDDIVLLCGKDRATGQGAENIEEGLEAMAEERKLK